MQETYWRSRPRATLTAFLNSYPQIKGDFFLLRFGQAAGVWCESVEVFEQVPIQNTQRLKTFVLEKDT